MGRPVRRGDNIPPVSDYAHWNEEAQTMWYAENKYDMEHADEIVEDDYESGGYYGDCPHGEDPTDCEECERKGA